MSNKKELEKIAREIKSLKDKMTKESASGTSWNAHSEKWFDDLGKLIEKHSSGKVAYKGVTHFGLDLLLRSSGERLATLALKPNRTLIFKGKLFDETFFPNNEMDGIAKTIAKLVSMYY